ncbi:hypothetical protein [Ensifer sp. YR511]|uniref:hypothetical protein n=1 Tax=Ensifer sp. YR511 TaxID=1855294 RepID=UPI000B7C9092|nr:hypothetical protein [Ensifer sp. YR511]
MNQRKPYRRIIQHIVDALMPGRDERAKQEIIRSAYRRLSEDIWQAQQDTLQPKEEREPQAQ